VGSDSVFTGSDSAAAAVTAATARATLLSRRNAECCRWDSRRGGDEGGGGASAATSRWDDIMEIGAWRSQNVSPRVVEDYYSRHGYPGTSTSVDHWTWLLCSPCSLACNRDMVPFHSLWLGGPAN
jgi:hypothetical protein